jgi:hypothetical protein
MKTKLSSAIISAFVFVFAAGLGFGYYLYLNHPAIKPNIPANNAIAIHLIIAACAVVTVTAIQLYRMRKHLHNIWAAPFSERAFLRFKATIIPRPVRLLSILRALVSILLLIVMLFTPFRIGAQIGDALDPTLPINAWGGPSYIGASLAHSMDMIIFLYVAALILHIVMVKKLPAKT